MRYKGRELRRLWKVKVYKGNPENKKPKFEYETIVAWNQTDAIRGLGDRAVAARPEEISYVTWPGEGQEATDIYEISDTAGPSNKKAKPSIPLRGEGAWDF